MPYNHSYTALVVGHSSAQDRQQAPYNDGDTPRTTRHTRTHNPDPDPDTNTDTVAGELTPRPTTAATTTVTTASATATPRGKELAEQFPALLRQQATGDIGAMVELGLGEDIEHAPTRARLGIAGAVDHPRNAGEDDRTGTHCAGLERDVEDAVENSPGPGHTSGLAQDDDLGVRGGVLAQLTLVVGAGDNLAVSHEHRANWHVLVFQRTFSLAQGQTHEVVVAWEEAFAHRSRP